MKSEITLKGICKDDWFFIMNDKRLRDLIGIPVFYFIDNGMFYVWPSPCSYPYVLAQENIKENIDAD